MGLYNLFLMSAALLSEPPPIIVHGPANQTLPIGGLALLPCQAQGRTQPIISWTKNGKTLETDSEQMERYSQLASGALRIDKLEADDSGYYSCHAENKDGQTVWTAQLDAEEPTNPSAHFHRMADPSTYPTQPGKPVQLNATDTSVALKWTEPVKQGASPITGYIVQYYSPEQGQTWFNVEQERAIQDTGPYIVRGLKPGSAYVFIVRAENSEGIGQPSTMSSVVRTTGKAKSTEAANEMDLALARNRLGAEMLIKLLEVTALNSTAVQLFWKPNRNEPLIQGYYIKWKGPKTTDGLHYMNITGANTRSRIIDKLEPFAEYTFFVVPYYRSIEGVPSNSVNVQTGEARPSITPTEVSVRMMNLTTLRISWRPPPDRGLNGKLTGYNIVARGNCSKCYRNISTNERAASVTLFHLRRSATYEVMVAAVNSAGIGKYFIFDPLVLDETTLRSHLALFAKRHGASSDGGEFTFPRLISSPWFIAVIGVILWIFLFLLIIAIWYCNKRRTLDKQKSSSAAYLSTPFIKINDASVVTPGREQLWLDHHSTLNSAQLMIQNGNNNNNNNGNRTAQNSQTKSPNTQQPQIFDDLRINSDGVFGFYGTQPIDIGCDVNDQQMYDVANTSEAPTTISRIHRDYENPAQQTSNHNNGGYNHQHPRDLESSFYHQVAIPSTQQPQLIGGRQQGGGRSPTPYATTTLVMDGHRDNILNELRLYAPTLPHSNPPMRPPSSGLHGGEESSRHSRTLGIGMSQRPPPTPTREGAGASQSPKTTFRPQIDHQKFSSPALIGNNYSRNNYSSNFQQSQNTNSSPPNTDISYVPSSDSGASSGNGTSSQGSSSHRCYPRAQQPELLDFIPPPPESSPPPPALGGLNDMDNMQNPSPTEPSSYFQLEPVFSGGQGQDQMDSSRYSSRATNKLQSSQISGGRRISGQSNHHRSPVKPRKPPIHSLSSGQSSAAQDQQHYAIHGGRLGAEEEVDDDYETLNQLLKSFHASSDPLENQQHQHRTQRLIEHGNDVEEAAEDGIDDPSSSYSQRSIDGDDYNAYPSMNNPSQRINQSSILQQQALYHPHHPNNVGTKTPQQSQYHRPKYQNHYNPPVSTVTTTTASGGAANNTNSLNDVHALITNHKQQGLTTPVDYDVNATVENYDDTTSPEISDLDVDPGPDDEACYSACHEFTTPVPHPRPHHHDQPLKIMTTSPPISPPFQSAARQSGGSSGSRRISPRPSSSNQPGGGRIVSPRGPASGSGGTLGRPNQPVMGINATTLSASSFEASYHPDHHQHQRSSTSGLSSPRSSMTSPSPFQYHQGAAAAAAAAAAANNHQRPHQRPPSLFINHQQSPASPNDQ